jgi:hypothetical protein
VTAAGWFLIGREAGDDRGQLDCPAVVDLGRLDPATARPVVIPIRNRTGRAVRLIAFSLSCTCIEASARVGDDSPALPDGVPIPAGGEAELRLVWRPAVGQPAPRAEIGFRCDPDGRDYTVRLAGVVRGLLHASPASVNVGTVASGTREGVLVVVRSADPPEGFGVLRATGSPGLSVTPVGRDGWPADETVFRAVACYRVSVTAAASPGPIDERLSVYLPGRADPALTVPVTGIVRPEFAVAPTTVRLPRQTGDGPSRSFPWCGDPTAPTTVAYLSKGHLP